MRKPVAITHAIAPKHAELDRAAHESENNATPTRFVGAIHIEFFRRVLNGEAPSLIADQYLRALEGSRTGAEIYERLAFTLATAAERDCRFWDARLFRLHFGQSPEPCLRVKVRRAFVEENGQSHQQLLSVFREKFGDLDASEAKRTRQLHELRHKANVALTTVAPQVAVSLLPGQRLVDWVVPSLADRLCAAGISTVGELVAFVNTHGYRFDRQIPRLGATAARELRSWLLFNADNGECTLNATAREPSRKIAPSLRSTRPRASDIVPLEYFVPPCACDGVQGFNRAPADANQTGATSDYEAIQAWIGLIAEGTATRLTYRKEAERLILWATLERRKAVSSLTALDCTAYLEFIQHPTPPERWIAARHIQRWDPAWRPFAGPLSLSSARTTAQVLKVLFSWLTDRGYLRLNPLNKSLNDLLPEPSASVPPYLSNVQWLLLDRHAKQTTGGMRSQAIISLAYWTSLSVNEMASARVSDLHEYSSESASRIKWVLLVNRRSGQPAYEPIADHLISHLVDYMDSRGFGRDLQTWPVEAALVGSLASEGHSAGALSPPALTAAIKTIFCQVADIAFVAYPNAAARLRKASARCIRHPRRNGTELPPPLLAPTPVKDDVSEDWSELTFRFDEIEKALAATLAPVNHKSVVAA
jgi:site-specific recombinase XerD